MLSLGFMDLSNDNNETFSQKWLFGEMEWEGSKEEYKDLVTFADI